MDYSGLVTGALFIVLGFLVKAFPILLAGYNTMTKEQKANVDIKKLSSFARNSLVGMGVLLIIAEISLDLFDLRSMTNYILFPIIIGGVIFMIAGAQKYDHNK
jgi:hypothetical protein